MLLLKTRRIITCNTYIINIEPIRVSQPVYEFIIT